MVVSPALRTRQTWDAFASGLGENPEVDVDRRVYANTVDDLLEVLGEVPAEIGTVLLVGHNPSVAALVAALDGDEGRLDGSGLAEGYPTGTLAVFDVDGAWTRIGPGRGTLREVIRRSH